MHTPSVHTGHLPATVTPPQGQHYHSCWSLAEIQALLLEFLNPYPHCSRCSDPKSAEHTGGETHGQGGANCIFCKLQDHSDLAPPGVRAGCVQLTSASLLGLKEYPPKEMQSPRGGKRGQTGATVTAFWHERPSLLSSTQTLPRAGPFHPQPTAQSKGLTWCELQKHFNQGGEPQSGKPATDTGPPLPGQCLKEEPCDRRASSAVPTQRYSPQHTRTKLSGGFCAQNLCLL